MGVDQNKRYLGQLQSPIKRESTAIPKVPTAGGFWDYSGGLSNREAITDQTRISSTFFENWIDLGCKTLNLLVWFFFVIGYHCWTQYLGRPEHSKRLKCNEHSKRLKCNIIIYIYIAIILKYNIDFSSYTSQFLYNKCLSQWRTNRRFIATQGFIQSRMLTYTCLFIILRLAYAIGSHMYMYMYVYVYIYIYMVYHGMYLRHQL